MTTAAIVVALAIVVSTVTGGNDANLADPSSAEQAVLGLRSSAVRTISLDAHRVQPTRIAAPYRFSLRIHGLSADGVATPEPVATAIAIPVSGVTPIPEPSPNPLSIPEIICSVSWPCWEAISVATCESGLNPRAVNPLSGTLGLYQLHPKFHTWRFHGGDPFDPIVNTAAAFSLYEEQGWWPWIECWRW